ncbi:MAG: polysaccharide pyruvyl transferase family protein [Nitrospira sp.]|nr:polysaccharide pyruvyl transferase family protein [Nitrospira sp.]
MKKKILHAHNYGHKNIGDDAMAENVYRKLCAIGDCEVTTISTYSPPLQCTKDIKSLSGIVNNYSNILTKIFLVGVHRVKLKAAYTVYVWLYCELCLLVAKIYKRSGVIVLPEGSCQRLIVNISTADIYVRSGSGSLNDIWFWSSMYPQYTEARLCNLFGVKVYFTGQGIGPLSTPYRKKILARFAKCCELITYRDFAGSKRLVNSVVDGQVRDETVGDDAFDCPKEALDEDVEALFSDNKKVLICQFRPTNYEVSLSDKYWRNIALALEQFTDADPSHSVVLVSFSNGRITDLSVSHKLYNYANKKLVVLEKCFSPGQAKTLLSRAYAAVGQSYHFGVFALSEDVPFIALYTNTYYEYKHLGLLGWYQMERYALSQNDITTLGAMLAELGQEHQKLIEMLRLSNQSIRKNINRIFATIDQQ